MAKNMDPSRFEQIIASEETSGTSLIRRKNPFIMDMNDYTPSQGNPLKNDFYGDFLSRLWALFGPPNGVGHEGFYYDLRDRETGLILRPILQVVGLAMVVFLKMLPI